MATTLARIIKFGLQSFSRNGWLSVTTIAVLILALIVFNGLILFSAISRTAVSSIQDKIDISVYFKDIAKEDEILKLERAMESLAEVKSVEYISQDKALEIFKNDHKDDPTVSQALAELQANPLLAALNVKANDPNQYASIVEYLGNENLAPIIEKVSYTENRLAIDRLARLIDTFQNSGLVATMFLALIAALVTFNSIRLAIYSNREEIGIMRLVGSSNKYINGPYLVNGIIYGAIAAVISLIIAAPVVSLASPYVSAFIPEKNLTNYFFGHLPILFGYQLLFGIFLGGVSSTIAVRRYLKV